MARFLPKSLGRIKPFKRHRRATTDEPVVIAPGPATDCPITATSLKFNRRDFLTEPVRDGLSALVVDLFCAHLTNLYGPTVPDADDGGIAQLDRYVGALGQIAGRAAGVRDQIDDGDGIKVQKTFAALTLLQGEDDFSRKNRSLIRSLSPILMPRSSPVGYVEDLHVCTVDAHVMAVDPAERTIEDVANSIDPDAHSSATALLAAAADRADRLVPPEVRSDGWKTRFRLEQKLTFSSGSDPVGCLVCWIGTLDRHEKAVVVADAARVVWCASRVVGGCDKAECDEPLESTV